MTSASFDPIYGANTATLRTDSRRRLTVTVPPLSAVVYRARGTVPASGEAPEIAIVEPRHNGEQRARMEVEADLGGDSFYEVTFQAKIGDDPWEPIGTDDNAPYRVFHDVYALEPGHQVQYRAVVLDNAGHTRESAARSARVGEPSVSVTVRPGVADRGPRHHRTPSSATTWSPSSARLGDGPWTAIGSDDSSPRLHRLRHADRTAPSTARSWTTAPARSPARRRARHRRRSSTTSARPATTLDWGVHLWGEAVAAPTDWTAPQQRDGADALGAVYEVRDRGPDQAGELHRPPAERGQRADHPRAGRRPLLRARRAQRDLAQAGRPDDLLQPAGMSWEATRSSTSSRP